MTQERRVTVMGMFVEDRMSAAPKVNEILSLHANVIVGRLGVPCRDKDAGVIALIIDGTADEVGRLADELNNVRGVKVKSTATP